MKDELTEKMHEEFFVDEETEKKHRAFSAWELIGLESDDEDVAVAEACRLYSLSSKDMFRYKDQFAGLREISRYEAESEAESD